MIFQTTCKKTYYNYKENQTYTAQDDKNKDSCEILIIYNNIMSHTRFFYKSHYLYTSRLSRYGDKYLPLFEDYFYTQQELRQLKLKKLNTIKDEI